MCMGTTLFSKLTVASHYTRVCFDFQYKVHYEFEITDLGGAPKKLMEPCKNTCLRFLASCQSVQKFHARASATSIKKLIHFAAMPHVHVGAL